MKTYLSILQYTTSLKKYIAPYFILSLLASIFGVLNFALLSPLLKVLFNQVESGEAEKRVTQLPDFSLSKEFFSDTFNYYLYNMLDVYGRMGALQFACAIIVVSVFLSNVFRYLSQRILKTVESETIASLRHAVFQKTVSLHLGFFNNERKGNLMSHLTTDIQEIENSIARAFTASLKEVFALVVYFVFLFTLSAKLTFFSILILPISGGAIAGITRRLRKKALEVQENLSTIISTIDEVLGGMRVVKAFNAEGTIIKQFDTLNTKYKQSVQRMVYRQEMTSPTSETLGVMVIAGILLYGGSLVINKEGGFTASEFISYLALFSQVQRPAKVIADAFSGVQRGVASAERIIALMETESAIQDQPNAINLPNFDKGIEFKNVSFSYNGEKDVLKNISFTIPKGQTVALVGESGGGKSTLADLVPRFYDPTGGEILLDGIDLKAISAESLHRQMGIVTQESILFNDTIENNIVFGANATEAQIIEAAKIANAHQFISQSPEGYQTVIGDRGSRLSGGQRQRLSIARAVLKNPPILILDEATSALDTESEKLVQEALTNLMKNRTTLVIAHRLSTIQNADKIIVISKGQIVEEGTHEELVQIPNGYYAKLSSLQS